MPRKDKSRRTIKSDRKARATGKEKTSTVYAKARDAAHKLKANEISVLLAAWQNMDEARNKAVSVSDSGRPTTRNKRG